MDNNPHDDLYAVLDEMNARLEEMVEGFHDPSAFEMVISKLQDKSQEFVYEFQQELEKLELLEMEV